MRPQPFKPDFRFPEITKWCGNCAAFNWRNATELFGKDGVFISYCKIVKNYTLTNKIGCEQHKEVK